MIKRRPPQFKDFWEKRRKLNPDEPRYISLCHILEGSGEPLEGIIKKFDTYMEQDEDYDFPERQIMIDYLFDISYD